MIGRITLAFVVLLGLSSSAFAQQDTDKRDGGMYFGDWRESMPRSTHGSLVERDILTRGDAMNPSRKGAVLTLVNKLAYATLAPQASTAPTKLQGEQEVFYFLSGEGTMTAGGETAELYGGISILVPAELEFVINNTGDSDLTMYLVNEPIPEGFRPNENLLVRDENKLPIRSTTGHWCHIVKGLFSTEDGLGTMQSVLTVSIDPMTIAEPHAHPPGAEEVWTSIRGESFAFVGTQIRVQKPGMGYLAPPGETATLQNVSAGKAFPHSNINTGTEQIKMFYFSRLRDRPARK